MASVLYYNGKILTMRGAEPETAEAVLEKNGRILAVGGMEEIMQGSAYQKTAESGKIVRRDLKGSVLLPAFIDSHSHITAVARVLGTCSLNGVKNFGEITDRLSAFREKTGGKPGEWLIGVGYDHNFLAEKRHPDKFLLDRFFPDNPVMISHANGHMGAVNSAALDRIGITAETENPKGGVIGRIAATGEPSGYLEETAFISAGAAIPSPTLEQMSGQFKLAEELYLQHGITTIQDGITKRTEWKLLQYMAEKKLLHADIVSYVDLKSNRSIAQDHPEYGKEYRDHLRIGGYKIFLDGSPQGRTAWMSRPYKGVEEGETDPYCGYPIYTDDEAERFFEISLGEGRQLLVHCNGDAAAQQMIDACRAASEKTGVDPSAIRPVMIHAQLVREDELEQMAELSITASFFAAHVYYWGDIHIKNFGEERAMRISPAKSAVRAGVNTTFHQDSPVIPPDMLETIWCAVNRVSREGVVMGAEERLTPYEALQAVTIHAAVQYGEEAEKGSIEAGKTADFVILDASPLEVLAPAIKDIRILETIKEGKTVYRKMD